MEVDSPLTWEEAVSACKLLPYVEQDPLWRATLAAYQADIGMGNTSLHVGYSARVQLFVCPADNASRVMPQPPPNPLRSPTSYLGVNGTNRFREDGMFPNETPVRFADITDGTSNTLMVGERPFDIGPGRTYGAWYGGWGSFGYGGVANSHLGVRESGVLQFVSNPSSSPCSDGPYSFQQGSLNDPCSVFHFWSMHPGGGNFLFADGSARFLPYAAVSVLPALATRAGGEDVSASY